MFSAQDNVLLRMFCRAMLSVSHLPPITSEDGPSHDPAAAISPLSSIRERERWSENV